MNCIDRQQEKPDAYCTLCGGELYDGDRFLDFDGKKVCRSCFLQFAAEYFGAELTKQGIRKDDFSEAY